MNEWQLREAQCRTEDRTMTRREWYRYRHETRWLRRSLLLMGERIGEIVRPVVEHLTIAFRELADSASALVASFEGNVTFQRWRLVNTLAEIAEMKEAK